MRHLLSVPFLLWSSVLLVYQVSPCPPDCICLATTVYCGNLGRTTIPLGIPHNTTHLYLDGNNLGTLTVNTIPLLPYLEELYLNSSHINRYIPKYMFSAYPQLRIIDLSENEIFYLYSDICSGLNLTALVLSNNSYLIDYDTATFNNCDIKELYIDSCSLTTLQFNEDVYNSLRLLNVSYNSDRLLIPPGLLQGAHLHHLIMEYANFTSPDFLNGASIRNLNLNGNNIINTKGNNIWTKLEVIHNVEVLHLRNTGLVDIQLPENINLLQYCILSHNYISEITATSFLYTPLLYTLDLSSNIIQVISGDFGSQLPLLTVLDLSTNYLGAINFQSFMDMRSLRFLDLSDNFLTSLDNSMQLVFSYLDELRMYNVPLNCTCDMLWFRQWVLVVSHAKSIQGASCATPVEQDILDSNINIFQCTVPNIRHFQIEVDSDQLYSTITCTASGDPTPHVLLTNFTSGSLSATQTVHVDGSVSTSLVVSRCILVGVYWCHAANVLGTSDSSYVITRSSPRACVPPTTTEAVIPVHTIKTTHSSETTISQIHTTIFLTVTTDQTTTKKTPDSSSTISNTAPTIGTNATVYFITPHPSTSTPDLVMNPPTSITSLGPNTTEISTRKKSVVLEQKSGQDKLSNSEIAGILLAVLVAIIVIIIVIFFIWYCYNKRHIHTVSESAISTISHGQNGITKIQHNGSGNGVSYGTNGRINGNLQNGSVYYKPGIQHTCTYINYTLEDVQV